MKIRTVLVAVGFSFGLGLVGSRNTVATEKPEAIIVANVLGLRNDVGSVRCLIFASPDGFPSKWERASGRFSAAIKDKTSSCLFRDLAPGKYAISYIHDENDNKLFDRTLTGVPKEGYGASNDARGVFGPPKFEDAAFEYRSGLQTLAMHTQY
jgi:uncharacterized protein (DUF2141 family)